MIGWRASSDAHKALASITLAERQDIHRRLRDISTKYAEAAGATATVEFGLGYPVTKNDPALTERMLPVLKRVAGVEGVITVAGVVFSVTIVALSLTASQYSPRVCDSIATMPMTTAETMRCRGWRGLCGRNVGSRRQDQPRQRLIHLRR